MKTDYLLLYEDGHLGLRKQSKKISKLFYLDFLSPAFNYRRQHASLRKELLARAMGISPANNPSIIDATAGFGRDSFILASLGFTITLVERSPIVHALLQDALKRAQQTPELAPIINRMTLLLADANDYLTQLNNRPEVIYLDPMFPVRQKSASVKKEMVILQDILGEEKDAETLFKLAITCATRRVVVKRPRLATEISNEIAPTYSLSGRSSRFDIYLTSFFSQ